MSKTHRQEPEIQPQRQVPLPRRRQMQEALRLSWPERAPMDLPLPEAPRWKPLG